MKIESLRALEAHMADAIETTDDPHAIIEWWSIGSYKAMVAGFNDEPGTYNLACALLVAGAALEAVSDKGSNSKELGDAFKKKLRNTIARIENRMDEIDE